MPLEFLKNSENYDSYGHKSHKILEFSNSWLCFIFKIFFTKPCKYIKCNMFEGTVSQILIIFPHFHIIGDQSNFASFLSPRIT